MKITIDTLMNTYIITDKDTNDRLVYFYNSSTSDIDKFLTDKQMVKFVTDQTIDFSLSKKRYKIMIDTFKSFCETYRIDKNEIIQRLGEKRYNEIFNE